MGASPFSFFRKHQGVLMVVLVVLAMLVFTLDSLFQSGEFNPILLGALAGGFLFCLAGIGRGKGLVYTLIGGVVGAIAGVVMPMVDTRDVAYATSKGNYRVEDVNKLVDQRNYANQFNLGVIDIQVRGQIEQMGDFGAQLAPFFRQQMLQSRHAQFGFGLRSMADDVLFGEFMRAKARELGIVVTDAMVNKHIQSLTLPDSPLTEEQYREIRSSIKRSQRQLPDAELTEYLRNELQAQIAYEVLNPFPSVGEPTPEASWEAFRRTNVRQQLTIAAIDVDQFLDQVAAKPTEGEIESLFTQYKDKYPGQIEPGSPGFVQPGKVSLDWMELNYDRVEKEVAEITDEEVRKYYDENRDDFKVPVMIDPDAAGDIPEGDPATPEGAAPEGTTPEGTTPEETPPEGTEPAAPEATTPAPEGEPGTTDDPAPEGATPEKTDPEVNTETDASSDPEESPSETTPDDSGNCEPDETDEGTTAAAAQESTESAGTPQEKTDETTTVAEESTTPDATQAAPTAPDTQDPAATGAPPLRIQAAEEGDQTSGTDGQGLTIPPAPTSPDAGGQTPEVQYEYKELDDELKGEIRDMLIRQRTGEILRTRMQAAVEKMNSYAQARADVQSQEELEDDEKAKQLAEFDRKMNAELKQYAEDNGLAWVRTPLISYGDLVGEDYPIGLATNVIDGSPIGGTAVADNLFRDGSASKNTYYASIVKRNNAADNFDNPETWFSYWVTGSAEAHIPELDDPGIRDEVVLAWKTQKAREAARARAEELEKAVTDAVAANTNAESTPSLAEVLEDKTVTGEENGQKITVRGTRSFSWYEMSTAGQQSMQQRPQLTFSSIRYADEAGGIVAGAGNQFMQQVFNRMKDGDIGVVPSDDLSTFYLVKISNRFPTPELGEDGVLDRFMADAGLGFQQSQAAGIFRGSNNALQLWHDSIWKEFGASPTGY